MRDGIQTRIISTGSYLPEAVVTNDMLVRFPPNARALVYEKTGVMARRHAAEGECTSDLASLAAVDCLKKAGFDPCLVDAVVLATSSPDRTQPATATRLQHKIGAVNAFAFDINSVCSGSVFGLALADSMIRSGLCRHVLFAASEVYSRILNPDDFSTYPYFGDGAAAALLRADSGGRSRITSLLKTDGSGSGVIQIPAGGTMTPYAKRNSDLDVYFKMNGKEVYAFAAAKGAEVINEVLSLHGVARQDVKFVVPHQANINIIREIAKNTDIGMERFVVNLDRYGNTASASVLIAFDELLSSGEVGGGDIIVTAAYGGGLSWGANIIHM